MPIQVHQFRCLEDNYGFLLRDEETGETASIDAPCAATVLSAAAGRNWNLTYIFNTHHHGDHIGGNAEIAKATGAQIVAPMEVAQKSHVDRIVRGGDRLALGRTEVRVLDTGGHTAGHVSYHVPADSAVFVGDTLFVMGCGRLFEGGPEQMWQSLGRLAALPDETLIYCAHEYSAANARFATSVDTSSEVRRHAASIIDGAANGEWFVPTRLSQEKRTNPFLRAPFLRPDLDAVEAFAEVRRAKDVFNG